MNNLEKLIRDHAYWSDERKKLKQLGSEEASKCYELKLEATKSKTRPHGLVNSKSCIEEVFDEMLTMNKENPYDHYPYDEVWFNAVHDGLVCIHCQNVRELKRQRAYAGTRLGAVRAAMTRIGRRLQEESGDD